MVCWENGYYHKQLEILLTPDTLIAFSSNRAVASSNRSSSKCDIVAVTQPTEILLKVIQYCNVVMQLVLQSESVDRYPTKGIILAVTVWSQKMKIRCSS
jgi:hypothetical protein